MRKHNKRRRRKRQLSLNQIVFFFVLLVIISAIIAFFIVRPDLSHRSPVNNITHSKTETHRNPLNGSWLNTDDGSILEIKGQSFSLEVPSVDQHSIETGNCIIRDKQVNFTGYDSFSPCKGKTGIYTFIKKDGHLHFTLIKDPCPGRRQRFTAVWDSI